jgi:hypothetical protein
VEVDEAEEDVQEGDNEIVQVSTAVMNMEPGSGVRTNCDSN